MNTDVVVDEIVNGDMMYVSAVPGIIRNRSGAEVSLSAVKRWVNRGVRVGDGRVYLEACVIAGKLATSRAALARFIRRQTPASEVDAVA